MYATDSVKSLVCLSALALLFLSCGAQSSVKDRNTIWREFAETLYKLHQKQIQSHEVIIKERTGGYMNQPEFYIEKSYFDKTSGRLLSRIQWEKQRPEKVHVIEIFIYDSQGRVIRDYIADFMPDYYQAFKVKDSSIPMHTLVSFHHYVDGLKAFRSFDASNDFFFEACRGTLDGKSVLIELDDLQRIDTGSQKNSIMHKPVYNTCFGRLPDTAGEYIVPH